MKIEISEGDFAKFWELLPAEYCECSDCKQMTREALDFIASQVQRDTIERCATKAKDELESWGIDLQQTSDAYRDAAVSGKFNGRGVSEAFAKDQATRFKERANAIYDFGEPLADAIRATAEKE